jgi:hypothetical protein
MENKLYILYGKCAKCFKGFERRYATKKGVKCAYTRARNKRYSCCTDESYTIGWGYDFAQEEIVKQATNIVNQSKGIVNQ